MCASEFTGWVLYQDKTGKRPVMQTCTKGTYMQRYRVSSLCSMLVLCCLFHTAEAQIPVTDVGNLLQNTLQAVQAVLMVGNQVLELTGLDAIVLGDDVAEDLAQLEAIRQEAQGLGTDISTIQLQLAALFDLNTAPRSSTELQQRLADIRRMTWTVYVDAIRTESLLQSSVSALRHLTRLIEAIGDFVGNNQGNQTLAQFDAKLTAELLKLRTQTGAYQRAHVVDRLAEPLIMESLPLINESLLSDHPR
jgi:conjugal transfer/entry exclusion protein